MKYGQIISQSWNLLWKHKILWVFGFLAALGGGGGNFNLNNPFRGSSNTPTNIPGQNILSPELRQQIEQLTRLVERGEFAQAIDTVSAIIGFPAIFLAALICFLIVFVFVVWLASLVARAGLVAAVQADNNSEQISFAQLFAAGTNKLWPLVGLKFTLFGIPGLLFFSFIVASMSPIFLSIMRGAATGQIEPPSAILASFPALACGFICIAIPLSIALSIVDGYAFRGIVMDDMEIFEGIKHGWRVGMDNLGPTILLSIVLSLIGLAVATVILIPVGIFTFIYDGPGTYITIALTSIVSLLIGTAVNTVFTALYSVAYSKAYLEFTGRKPALVDIALATPSAL